MCLIFALRTTPFLWQVLMLTARASVSLKLRRLKTMMPSILHLRSRSTLNTFVSPLQGVVSKSQVAIPSNCFGIERWPFLLKDLFHYLQLFGVLRQLVQVGKGSMKWRLKRIRVYVILTLTSSLFVFVVSSCRADDLCF